MQRTEEQFRRNLLVDLKIKLLQKKRTDLNVKENQKTKNIP